MNQLLKLTTAMCLASPLFGAYFTADIIGDEASMTFTDLSGQFTSDDVPWTMLSTIQLKESNPQQGGNSTIEFSPAPLTFTVVMDFSRQVSAGFGKVKTLDIHVEVDYTSSSIFSAIGDLVPALDGYYNLTNIRRTWDRNDWPYLSGSLTGRYEISGPTEASSGTFDFSTQYGAMSYHGAPIDLNLYPDSATLDASALTLTDRPSQEPFFPYADRPLFSVTVDGIAYSLSLNQINAATTQDIVYTWANIPEAASLPALAGLGALGLMAWRRRRA